MAHMEKFTHAAIVNLLRHNSRSVANSANKDIDPDRQELNYSFPLDHGGLSDFKFYKNLLDTTYLYGRGSSREEKAVTVCGWVVSLPKELLGKPEKEKAFFKGTLDFISERYGKENIVNNSVHYDEKGLPHIHVLFCPITTLDHDVVRNKTVKTKEYVQLPSGRYEYKYRFKTNENGQYIPIKNYAKMSDLYDTKLDAKSVLNAAELAHFHGDLAAYLSAHGIEGNILNGSTGTNFSVKELKEFTQKTGLTLDDVKGILDGKPVLETLASLSKTVEKLNTLNAEKDTLIENLKQEISRQADQIKELTKIIDKSKELTTSAEPSEPQEKKKQFSWSKTPKEKERDDFTYGL